jgi:hypothetical protein
VVTAVETVASVAVADGLELEPQPATRAASSSRGRHLPIVSSLSGRPDDGTVALGGFVSHSRVSRTYPVDVSLIAVILLAAALVLIGATEWPRLARRTGLDTKVRHERKRRKSHLRIVDAENDDFAKAVERDLAALPTIDDRD